MTYQSSATLRHTPKQTRGQRKVEHILRSAEALFAEMGYESATTNAIAARAGISIGSLYQFFSSKEAIFLAIAERYLALTRAALDRAFDSTEVIELDDFLSGLLKTLIRLQEQRPYFLQCLSQSRSTGGLSKVVGELNSAVASRVMQLLERGTIEQDRKALELRAIICVEVIGALLPLAVHSRGRERSRVNEEIKSVLIRYVGPSLKVEGVL